MQTILVVQFRTDVSEPHDEACIRASVGAHVDQLQFINAVKETLPLEIPNDVVGIIFSGSGEFFLGKGDGQDTWLPQTFSFLNKAMKKNIPVLGICFGHQIILMHEGAEIKQVEECREVGTFTITKTDAAKDDPIFSQLPTQFKGMLGHKETPINMPSHIKILASSERVLPQAIRIQGKDVWSTMFHPELTLSRMAERLYMFPNYAEDPSQLEKTLALFEDTPDAGKVLVAFVEYAFLKAGVEIIADPPEIINF